MAQDTYAPDPPHTAACPYCATTIDGAPSAGPTILRYALLRWACPACGGRWDEHRGDAEPGAVRFWSAPVVLTD
jgi:hypothetical protein